MGSFSIRFLSRDGFRESPWLQLAPGVSVLTGRNNVGKSRVLRAIANLLAVFEGGQRQPVPEVRLVGEGYELEADVTGTPPPRRWVAAQSGQPNFEARWTTEGGNLVVENSNDPSSGRRIFGAPGPTAASQAGNPLSAELRLALQTTVYFQPQRVPEVVATTNPEQVPSPDAGNLGRGIDNH